MISVCMAIFNGENYLLEQLQSILSQIGSDDELIIVDDCSSDRGISIIESLRDKRIKLFRNEKNEGVVKTFGKAINLSKGDYIFLSDQDDIWMPSKVEITMSYFLEYNPDLVLSDAYIFESGILELDSFFQYRMSDVGFIHNLVKNSFIGCCMAFKGSMKEIILPLPLSISMHDAWIGLLVTMCGKVILIPDRLVIYRRHSSNVTGMTRSSIFKMLTIRFLNVVNILMRSSKTRTYG